MRALSKRLRSLEQRVGLPEEEVRRREARAFLSRLSDEELDWLLEPDQKAQALVACTHVGLNQCGCSSSERTRRGWEAHPELRREYERRFDVLSRRARHQEERTPEKN